MSTLTVDIVARVNDTLRKLGATEKQIEAVNDALRQSAPASKQAAAAMNDMAAASAKAGASAKGSSQKFFQLGQAISDFSVAGIRGAANNLEFLALQIGVGGPLLLAISAATSALVVFGDDILRALDPVGERVKELKKGLEDVLTVIETRNVDLFLFEEQLPAAIAEAEEDVKRIKEELATLRPQGQFGQGAVVDFFGTNPGVKQLKEDLADAKALIEDLQAKQEELRRRDEAAGAGRTLTAIRENEEAGKALRAEIERIGLADQLGRITDQQLVQITREGDLREFILGLQEKAAKAGRKRLTDLEREQKKVAELTSELEQRRSGELDTLTVLRDQTAELQKQIARVKALNIARNEQAARGTPQRAGIAGLQLPDGSIGATLDNLRKAREQEQKDRQRNEIGSEFLRTIPESTIQEVTDQAAKSQQALRDEFALTMDMASALAAEINYGLSDSLISLADSFGVALTSSEGFQGLGNTVLLTLADLAGNVGRIAIGTGIAIAGIKKALETLNPIVAIGAGVALVALSAAVKSKLGAAAGGGSSYSGGGGAGSSLSGASQERLDALGYERLPNGAVVPAGAFQPSAPDSVSYTPLPPANAQRVIVEGTFDLEGENLRAAVRNTDKRVEKTRGVAA